MQREYSFSQYSTFMSCPKKFYWSYVRRLVPAEDAKSLRQGIEFHDGVAGLKDISTWNKIGQLARLYWHPRPGETAEVRREVDMGNGLKLICIADAVCDTHVIEYKTTSRPDPNTFHSLALSLQNRIYCIAFEKPSLLLRVCAKSRIRQKKDESEDMFETRLLQEYQNNPGDHFMEVEVPLVKKGAIAELTLAMANAKVCEDKNIWPMAAPYGCYGLTPCPYLSLCSDEETNLPLFKEKERV